VDQDDRLSVRRTLVGEEDVDVGEFSVATVR
jgi:hypothetical protein